MNLAEELQALEELRRTGSLTNTEFAQAKARLLDCRPTTPEDVAEQDLVAQLAEARCQAALAKLDLEWERERQKHLIHSRRGSPTIPTVQMAYALFGVGAFFGLFTAITCVLPIVVQGIGFFFPPVFFPVPILAFGFGVYIYRCVRRYETVLAAYQSRRSAIRPERYRGEASS